MRELPKTYDPKEVESKLYQFWCDGGYFHTERDPEKKPFTIVMPPPNVTGQLDTLQALAAAQDMGLQPREILREVERKHIFTHIQWNMKGIYLEVSEPAGGFQWFTPEQIRSQAALPTAFKQFWDLEDIENV